ncbi:MAG: ABC transporter ATP-binding protein [Gemmatimonadetes bacterium]|nr:ABC transporter ATP-binding protein [Gemmatimonadota bacterium]
MIRVSEISKFFGGKRALGPVSFEIATGETVGFLGLNGAGKTTLLRILACDLRPSAGSFAVDGIDGVATPHHIRSLVGFLPETPPIYSEMTVGEYLRFAGQLRGLTGSDLERRLPQVEEITNVRTAHHELLRHLSHGYRQRVGLAQAIIHEPQLLILDEPTTGLDPAQIVEMRTMIQGLKEKHTVLISSHILPEIHQTCDRLLVLRDGELVATGTEQDLSTQLESCRIAVSVALVGEHSGTGGVEAVVSAVTGVHAVAPTERDDGVIDLMIETGSDIRADLSRALVQAGYGVIRIDRADMELEEVFLQIVHGEENGDS